MTQTFDTRFRWRNCLKGAVRQNYLKRAGRLCSEFGLQNTPHLIIDLQSGPVARFRRHQTNFHVIITIQTQPKKLDYLSRSFCTFSSAQIIAAWPLSNLTFKSLYTDIGSRRRHQATVIVNFGVKLSALSCFGLYRLFAKILIRPRHCPSLGFLAPMAA